jgi:hypothetical protein
MAHPGFGQLGALLAGGNEPSRALAEAEGQSLGANTENAIAQANSRIAENKQRAGLADKVGGYVKDPNEAGALSSIILSGYNPEQFMQAHAGAQRYGSAETIAQPDTPENHAARVAAAQSIDPQSLGNALNPANEAHIGAETTQLIPAQAAAQQAAAQHSNAQAKLAEEEAKNSPHIGSPMDANGNVKAPAGFQWAYDDQGKPVLDAAGRMTQVPVTGGGKDPNAPAAMGSREAGMFARVLNSASLGTAALRNISRGNVGQSTGVAGIGASPGHSALSSTLDTLRNTLSSDEVQQYNVMNTGLSRNLASVEGGGLITPGQFSDQIGQGTSLRAGDTEETKLMKLAETRQILETGLNTALANPRVSKPQKDLMHQHVAEIQAAIPFTVEDVQGLKAQPKGSAVTMQDLISQRGLRKPGGAAPAAAPGATAGAADYSALWGGAPQ